MKALQFSVCKNWSSILIVSCFSVSLHLCTDGCVCKLQILVLAEDRWHTSRWSLPQSPSGQQQRYAQAAENEQLSSCLSSRCAVVLPDILVKCIVVFIKLRGINVNFEGGFIGFISSLLYNIFNVNSSISSVSFLT